MIAKLVFIGVHFAGLLVFVMACFGLGMIVFRRVIDALRSEHWLRFGLTVTFGLGVVILALQLFAIMGVLTVKEVITLITVGCFFAIVQWRQISLPCPSWRSLLFWEKIALLMLTAALLRTLLAPFHPSSVFDEVMYHLPHALRWKEAGRLTVNMWLRYPWFPFNYELLYSAALLIYDDIFAHLLHALAGWLCVLLIFQVCLKFTTDRVLASIAAVIWLVLTAEEFDGAYIDMGVALFVLGAAVAMWLWWESEQTQFAWIIGSFFLLGVAAGAKYQALTFIPIFVGAMLVRDRRLRVIGLALPVLMIPCLYWYARNALMTGDPFDPLGGPLFGFSDWNIGDYQYQIGDLHSHAARLPWLLWPAFIVPMLSEVWRSKRWRLAMGFGGYSILVWYVMTGGYVRYLIPALPVLSVIAARGWGWLLGTVRDDLFCDRLIFAGMNARSQLFLNDEWKRRFHRMMFFLCIIVFAGISLPSMRTSWREIAVTKAEREAYLSSHIPGYNVLTYLKRLPDVHAYQFGLEDAIYYAPQPIWGDWFGPGRYRDFCNLSAQRLAYNLTEMGLNTLIVHHARWPMITAKPEFSKYFELIIENQGVSAYRIKAR